jgi:hypothetical protein
VSRPEARWRAALAEHRAALEGYAAAVRALDGEAWTRPWAPGKWTPAEVTEHLALSYRAFIAEAEEGRPMKLKMTRLRRTLLRWFLLPHMLFHRTFPVKAVAPREVRPAGNDGTPEEALAELLRLGAEAEAALERARARPGAVLTHPYFGSIELTRAVRFCAVHLEHHTRQVRQAATG